MPTANVLPPLLTIASDHIRVSNVENYETEKHYVISDEKKANWMRG